MRNESFYSLSDYSELMKQIIEFIQTPLFIQFYHERKLVLNLIKRCILEPFCAKFGNKEDTETEKERLAANIKHIQNMNYVLL
jgi:hypothetical protein